MPKYKFCFSAFLFFIILLIWWRKTSSKLALYNRIANCSLQVSGIKVSIELIAIFFGRLLCIIFPRGRFGPSDDYIILFFFNHFDFFYFPEPIKYVCLIRLIYPFFEENLIAKVVGNNVLVILSVNEVDNIMVTYFLPIYLHLKLIVSHQFEYSFWDVLVNYQVTASPQHNRLAVSQFVCSRELVIPYLLIIFLFEKLFNSWWVQAKLRIILA